MAVPGEKACGIPRRVFRFYEFQHVRSPLVVDRDTEFRNCLQHPARGSECSICSEISFLTVPGPSGQASHLRLPAPLESALKGERMNRIGMWRVYREAGLCLKRKKRKRRVRAGQPARRLSAANRERALDFV